MNFDIVHELETGAAALGLTMDDLCAKADVARSTVVRWKAKQTKPNLGTYFKLKSALDKEAKKRKKKMNGGS